VCVTPICIEIDWIEQSLAPQPTQYNVISEAVFTANQNNWLLLTNKQ